MSTTVDKYYEWLLKKYAQQAGRSTVELRSTAALVEATGIMLDCQ